MTFALIDCNNFYASCERLFNPRLQNKPVIILSSNDGCVIARSNEAKALGIQMSQPYFQIRRLCEKNNVAVMSSNFALYGDISRRVMQILKNHSLDCDIYSIDEAFLRLDKIRFSDPFAYAQKIRKTVLKNSGIPVSIGIAPTKTLAKVAALFAKQCHRLSHDYVFDLRNDALKSELLKTFPVDAIWGVGKQSALKLHDMNIHTASQLCAQDIEFLKKRFSLMMKKVVLELRGIPCVATDEVQSKQNITCSRSFGKSITELKDLLEAISHYTARACEKARRDKMKAKAVLIYLRTGLFNGDNSYSASETEYLLYPSSDTIAITTLAQSLLTKIYRPGFLYKKAGITLCDLLPEKFVQEDLFCEVSSKDSRLIKTMDAINHAFGGHQIFLGAEGTTRAWVVKSTSKSPAYTTRWSELKTVLAN